MSASEGSSEEDSSQERLGEEEVNTHVLAAVGGQPAEFPAHAC